MEWDTGRSLGLVPGEDRFRKLTQEELAAEQKADKKLEVGGMQCQTM